MRRQEEGGRPVLPPKEEPRWRRKRESTREEAHPPPLWVTRNVSALTRGDEREADGASPRLSVRNRAGAPALSPTGSTWRPAATGKITGFGLHRVTETPSPSHHGRRRQTRGNPRTSLNATDACIWSATGSAPRNPAAAPVSHRFGGKEAAAAPSPRPNPRVRKDPGSGQDLERGPRARRIVGRDEPHGAAVASTRVEEPRGTRFLLFLQMRSPWKQRATSSGNTTWMQRTRPVEQSPEVEPFGPPDGKRHEGRRPRKGHGCGRGRSFEGPRRRRGGHVVRIPQGIQTNDPKPGEPQDRQRGATDPQDSMRSKPSRRRETAKVEQDSSSGNDGPKRPH
jgi:hypothetical protein